MIETTTPPSRSRQRMVRRSVRNRRYSDCGSADLKDLDWERGWWTDNSFGAHYLHVWHKDGETIHRVFCRGHETPRLEMVRGKLMWLYTLNNEVSAEIGKAIDGAEKLPSHPND